MEEEIYDYLNDTDDLFQFKVKFIQDENELLVALPIWMQNVAGNTIADFITMEFYRQGRTDDYVGTYKNMTITIQHMEENNYYVVVDFDLDAVETDIGLGNGIEDEPK